MWEESSHRRFIWLLGVTTLLLTQTTDIELIIGETKVYLCICLLMVTERHRWPSEIQTRILPRTDVHRYRSSVLWFWPLITYCGFAWRIGEVSLTEQVGLYRSNMYSERCRFEFHVGY